jgi:hypothetical protein
MCQNLDFFSQTKEKNRFHYKVILKNDIEISPDYSFRSEYFIKKENVWYYDRKIFFWHFKFAYDAKQKIFYFNKWYGLLPCRVGGIFLVGEHIAGIINLDLFLSGFIFLRGMAAQINNKNICISAPGFNGKTSWLKKFLKKGGAYIAEDHLIIDFGENRVYPTCPFLKKIFGQGRKASRTPQDTLKEKIIFGNSLPIDKLYLLQNFLASDYQAKNKNLFDFIFLNSLYFFNNLFVRSYIFEEGLTAKVFERITALEKINMNYNFFSVKDFNIDFIC